ncbi:glycosyltransferase family protein [Wolbachia endosymbiont of Onchocerca gibsoni]|uniref:hypothetical protein n=1 Tax=Wolbachia endosymbiont of Onchocerca gibsoni TaxID=118986 RepID=UPI0023D8C7A2|nr:hypothetical protein [Wolbachia endosymbiont of Onchocerca gibsoni]
MKLFTEKYNQEILTTIEEYTLSQYFKVTKVFHSFSKTKAKSYNHDMNFAKKKVRGNI